MGEIINFKKDVKANKEGIKETYFLLPLKRKEGKKKEVGRVVVQLEKDWITAVRNVSANKNSPWPLGSVLSQHLLPT